MGDTGGSRGVTMVGTNNSSGSLVLISISMSSTVFDEAGGSRDIVGTSSLLFDRGRSLGTGGGILVPLLTVLVRDVLVVDNRDNEFNRSRTKEFVSGS